MRRHPTRAPLARGLQSVGRRRKCNDYLLRVSERPPLQRRSANLLSSFLQDAPLTALLGALDEIGLGQTLLDGRVVWFETSGHTCLHTRGPELTVPVSAIGARFP
jgi:hypothetical protein